MDSWSFEPVPRPAEASLALRRLGPGAGGVSDTAT